MDLFRKIGSYIGLTEAPQTTSITSPETSPVVSTQSEVSPTSNKRKLDDAAPDEEGDEGHTAKRRQIETKSRQDFKDWFDGSRADVHTVSFETAGILGVVLQEVDDGVCLNKVSAYIAGRDSAVAAREQSEHDTMRIGDYVIALNKADVRHLGVNDIMKLMVSVKRPLMVTFRHAREDELRALALKWPSRFSDKNKNEKERKKAKRKENKKKKKNAASK